VFDSVCANVDWSPAEYYDLWYVLATPGRCALQLLLVYCSTRWSVYKISWLAI